ncbi:uncharacterized protein BX663DRAFT_520030 [Cokeromyces recurvatus]|uniref:uncharacterized protein n=1 Tax=Cokeromyces recurvatus TaxID=90255 RepID=UPI0022200590|nr:uncharacterized protein BX663DRAFT_520030 [Cokeromyces recurvatus]KAI7899687.1 hypothetical protein BX663DRAFT_520030 [Cokeromyces recurvatus]
MNDNNSPRISENKFMNWISPQTKELFLKYNIANLLFCYCLPLFYVFYPTLLMPAIFLRFLSFIIGWIYKLISSHHYHHHPQQQQTTKGNKGLATNNNNATISQDSHMLVEDEMNNMYFWLQRCSICLDQTYNLCLETCRDQFCKECFSRYIEETVNQSWGLGVTRIKCPVCQEVISQNEWSRYVSSDIIEKYNKYNQPYRPFSRYCNTCQAPVAPCQSPRKSASLSRESRLEQIASDLNGFSKSIKNNPNLTQLVDETLMTFLTACQKGGSSFRIGRIQGIYNQIIPILCKIVRKIDYYNMELYERSSSISKQLVALEVIPEAWKQTQFWHIANFPIETCSHCGDKICLQCGEMAHLGTSCLENLKLKLKKNCHNELAETIQWKLNHTRPCPNCSVMINRDEGCNRVDCLLCGYRFCWRCGSSWAQVCINIYI